MRRIIGRMTVVVALVVTTVVGGTASAGPSGGALPPVLIEVLQVGGEHGVPADAAMVAATVTAIDPAENGWIKAFPCDAEPPDTANLNYAADRIANNLVLARLAADGTLCIATRALTDYVVDLAGYVPAGSSITPLPSPVRALDTRNGTGGSNPSPVPDGGTVELQLGGDHGIPAEATLAVFNVTAVGGPVGGRITAHPCDESPGTTSSVNFPAGRNVANLVVSRLSADGAVCLLAKNASDMVVDVAGYATGGITTLPTPRRVLDTRSRGGLLDAESSVTVDPRLPDGATAAIYNLTAVDAPSRGFATAHPCDEPRPTSSNLNFNGTHAVGAGSITKLAADGTFCVFAKSPVNLIVDLIGYTTDDATYVPMSPVRLKDTRDGWEPECDVGVIAGDATWVAFGLSTGTAVTLSVPPIPSDDSTRFVRSAWIHPECQHAIVEQGTNSEVWSVPLDGRDPTKIADVRGFGRVVGVLDDGTIVGYDPGVLPDGSQHPVFFDVLTGDDLVRDAVLAGDLDGISADGSVLIEVNCDDAAPGRVAHCARDFATGALLAQVDLPVRARVSPDGLLLSYSIDTTVHIVSWSGDIVSSFELDADDPFLRGWVSSRSLRTICGVYSIFGERIRDEARPPDDRWRCDLDLVHLGASAYR